MAGGNRQPLEDGLKTDFKILVFFLPFVPRRASAGRTEISARTVYPPQAGLNPPLGGRASARSGRNGEAQGQAGHGRFLLLRFLFT